MTRPNLRLPRNLVANRLWMLAVLGVAGALALATVPPGHNKVATLFGEVQSEPYEEGLHLVNPLLNFSQFDLRQQTFTWHEVYVPAQDKLKTSMDVSVTFRIQGSRTPEILRETGSVDDAIEKHVTPKVRSLLREAGKSVTRSQDFFREEVQQELQRYMEEGLKEYLLAKGVIVEAVLFTDITLPEVVQNAVIQTKERQEQLEREKAQLQIVEQQALGEVKKAQAHEQAALAHANAKRTQADAEAYRIRTVADAQAGANTELAGSLTNDLLRYRELERWNGTVPQTVLSGEAGGWIVDLKGSH
jgi:regulator of protease activity HflC (stomatin/prohibitin superfamily)